MAMEKYGVDMEKMPPTEEQLEKLKAMGLPVPDSFKEAQEVLSNAGFDK